MVHALHGQRSGLVTSGAGMSSMIMSSSGVHVHVAVLGIMTGKAVDAAGVDDMLHGKLKLVVGSAQVGHKVQAVVVGLLGVGTRTVDLVDDDHDL